MIKRQFSHMVKHVFDNSDLPQEIFAIDTWGAVICSLGHGRKHMLTTCRLYRDQDLGNLISVDLLLKHVLALYAGGLKIRQSRQNRHHHIAELNAS